MRHICVAAIATAVIAAAPMATPPAEAEEIAVQGVNVIDLTSYFPNPQMAGSHYLRGSQPNTDWHFHDLSGDGSFFAWQLVSYDSRARDTYVIFDDLIALIGHTFIPDDQTLSTVTYLPEYPSFWRYLDLDMLPFEEPHPSATYAYASSGQEAVIGQSDAMTMRAVRDGQTIRLQWGDPRVGHYETMILGNVPIEGTEGLTAPGLVGYQTSIGGGISTRFHWARR